MGFLANVKQVGKGLVYIDPVTRDTDPGYGQGHPGGRPDQGLPGYGHPDQDLPWHGHPDQDLPGFGDRPNQGLPGYGHPDQGLPGYGHPDQGLPGSGARPSNPIVIPYPPEIQPPPERPIVVPKPKLPPGSLIAVPLPTHVPVPAPTTPVTPGAVPYVVWGGPGTDSKLVYLSPPEEAAPK